MYIGKDRPGTKGHFEVSNNYFTSVTYNMLYTMSMRRLYNKKTSYIHNLQLIYTFEYNTLYRKIKTCYVTKVVCNMYKLLYTLLYDMLYSCLENQCNT